MPISVMGIFCFKIMEFTKSGARSDDVSDTLDIGLGQAKQNREHILKHLWSSF